MNDLLREAAERLRAAGIESPRAEARLLWEHAQKLAQSQHLTVASPLPLREGANSSAGLRSSSEAVAQRKSGARIWGRGTAQGEHPLPQFSPAAQVRIAPSRKGRGKNEAEAYELFQLLLQRRLKHEPLAYLTGHKEFWSLDFEVGPGVLIPRPETETLIEVAFQELPDRDAVYRVLDLGTGTGCLLIALLSERPNATGVGIEAYDAALGWARRNVARHGLVDRIELVQGGWEAAEGGFDLILSNPPYIPTAELAALPPDVRDYEPKPALDGGPDGLGAYRAIAPVLKRHLKPEGLVLLEIGAGQHHPVSEIIAAEGGLRIIRIASDLAGIPRCILAGLP